MKNKKQKWNKKWLVIGIVLAVLWFIDLFSFVSLGDIVKAIITGYLYIGWLGIGLIFLSASPDF